jgi:hypothetical protein
VCAANVRAIQGRIASSFFSARSAAARDRPIFDTNLARAS